MKIIDPHLHLFDLAKGQYDWLKSDSPPFWPDKAVIQKDFSPQDLSLAAPFELSGFVHIEAGFNNQQPWQEIAWLEKTTNLPFKSIGSVDLTATKTDFADTLSKLTGYSSLVGVRHILDQQAHSLLTQQSVIDNIAMLTSANLIFEAQLSGCDSPAVSALISVAKICPGLTVILNHANFCPDDQQQYRLWQQNMAALAQQSNIYVKASGWEMVDRAYQLSRVKSVVSFLIGSFGSDRVMLASNFPLCLLSKSYDELWQQYQELGLAIQTLELLMYQNAKRIYRF